MTTAKILKRMVTDIEYYSYINKLFGATFTMGIEPHIYHVARTLSTDYKSGTWDFFALNNGGFFMSPRSNSSFDVRCVFDDNVKMSAESFGITSCLCAYHQLYFDKGALSDLCGRQYSLLGDFRFEHPELPAIQRALA